MTSRHRVFLVAAIFAATGCFLFLRSRMISFEEPRIEIHKSARELIFIDRSGSTRRFPIGLGFNPSAPKIREGDGATPEGHYFLCVKNPDSKYHLSLGISYPGPEDAERGRDAGMISEAEHAEILRASAEGRTPPWKTALGGEIFIHGRGASADWTQGCVALEDEDMTALFDRAEVGIPVIIFP